MSKPGSILLSAEDVSLYTLLQVFPVTVFEKMPIQAAILATPDRFDDDDGSNQLELFTF